MGFIFSPDLSWLCSLLWPKGYTSDCSTSEPGHSDAWQLPHSLSGRSYYVKTLWLDSHTSDLHGGRLVTRPASPAISAETPEKWSKVFQSHWVLRSREPHRKPQPVSGGQWPTSWGHVTWDHTTLSPANLFRSTCTTSLCLLITLSVLLNVQA